MSGFSVRKPTPLLKGSGLGRDPGLQVQTELLTWLLVKHVVPQHRLTFETGDTSPVKPPGRSRTPESPVK